MKKQVELAYMYYMSHNVYKRRACEMFGLSPSALNKFMTRKGLEDREHIKEEFPSTTKETALSRAYKMLREGTSLEEVKEVTKSTASQIRTYIKENNLEEIKGIGEKVEYNSARTKEAYEWKMEFDESYAEASHKFGVTEGAIKAYRARLIKGTKNKK
ncbi:MAG: hypothetical protein ACRC6E_06865 [Fusobacteriaceae bacterium]